MFAIVMRRNFWIVLAIDTLLCLAAYYGAYLIRFEGSIGPREMEVFRKTVVWIVPLKVALLLASKLYRGMWRYTSLYDFLNLLKALIAGSLFVLLGALLLNRFEGFSRGVFFIDFLLTAAFLEGFRLIIRLAGSRRNDGRVFGRHGERSAPARTIVIVGAGATGEKLLREIRENPRLNYDVAGFVDDNPSKVKLTIHGVPVLGQVKDLQRVVREMEVDEIIIAVPSASASEMRRVVTFCKNTGIPFKTVPGIGELIEGKVSVNAIREVRYEDLLGREQVEIEVAEIGRYLTGKRVMVTGAAGSIGSELCRQIAAFNPVLLVLVDRNESGLYDIEMEFRTKFPQVRIAPVLANLTNKALMQKYFEQHRAQVVFHAAAYKHVPMMELHPWEAVFNNVVATRTLLSLCAENHVEKCVVVSTDKAVRPTNVMGACKRLTELLAQAYARENHCRIMAVRFGNVIGSVGSVVPLFRKQIAQGGPVTVTHKDITRYFMTIPEACRLILQAGAIGNGGEIFVLKMGTPIRIDSLARDMITLSGLRPDEDIAVEYIGLRPGEKLYEELISDGEDVLPTRHDKIMVLASNREVSIGRLSEAISDLVQLAAGYSASGIKDRLSRLIDEYTPYADEASKVTTIPALRNGGVLRPEDGNGRADADERDVRILVVDDEKAIADMLAERLNRLGYSTLPVYTAREGLSAFEKEEYDIVITDLMMPDMRGTQLVEAIRKQSRKAGVIIMTGYATIESEMEALHKGAQDFISKPFTFKELETVIRRTLGRGEAAKGGR